MKSFGSILFILGLLWSYPETYAKSNCFSCLIKVSSLDEPIDLSGNWLVTREDRPENKEPDLDTSDWVLAFVPGNLNKAYDDGKNFRVSWYRAEFEFAPELIGQEVFVLLDSYLAYTEAYVDGDLIFKREGLNAGYKYYAAQILPLKFLVTQTRHVLALRIDSLVMSGIYQQPLQLRAYKADDLTISFWQFYSGDLRIFSSFLAVLSTLLFILYYMKTRYELYLWSAVTCAGYFPFFFFLTDIAQAFIPVEVNFSLHYLGLVLGPVYLNVFANYQYKYNKTYITVVQILGWLMSLWFIKFAFQINLDQLQIARKVAMIFAIINFTAATYMYFRCLGQAQKRNTSIIVLFLSQCYVLTVAIHDILVALGYLNSIMLSFSGCFVIVGSILFASSNIFADAFMQNRHLVQELKNTNERLEEKVRERTRDIQEIFDNVQHGFLLVEAKSLQIISHTASCKEIFCTDHLSGRNFVELLNLDAKAHRTFLLACEQVVDNILPHDVSAAMIPKRFEVEDEVYNLAATIIENDQKEVVRLLFSIVNVTKLEASMEENAYNRSLLKIVAHRGAFIRFLEETMQCLEKARKSLKTANLRQTRMELHTIKGNALVFGMEEFGKAIHEVESRAEIGMNDLSNLEQILNNFLQRNQEILNLNKLNPNVVTLSQEALFELQKNIEGDHDPNRIRAKIAEFVDQARYRPVNDLLGLLPEQVQSLAKKLGKQVQLEIKGTEICMDPSQVSALFANLVHALRNSIDHGIEDPEERKSKNPTAQIMLEFLDDAQHWQIRIADDGRGLDPVAIGKKAVALGLVSEEKLATLSEHEIQAFIFEPGFSTKEEVTETSGRGMGMSALAACIKELHGEVSFTSSLGQGTELLLRWPKKFYHLVA